MARTRPEPWNSFAAWLTAQRGLNASSVSTYLTQVRRMLAAVTPLNNDGLVAWIDALPSHHRSPHRAAWRCYVAWRASEGEDVPDVAPPEPSTPPPADVVEAIDALLTGSHLRPRDVVGLTWGQRVHSEAKERAFPDRVFFSAPAGVKADFALLPCDPLAVITAWAYGDNAPTGPRPVLPRTPHDAAPMAATTIQRLLRERRRSA
jgi:hypothetical protein